MNRRASLLGSVSVRALATSHLVPSPYGDFETSFPGPSDDVTSDRAAAGRFMAMLARTNQPASYWVMYGDGGDYGALPTG